MKTKPKARVKTKSKLNPRTARPAISDLMITAPPTSSLPRAELVVLVNRLKELSIERNHYVRTKTRLTNQMKSVARKILGKDNGEKVSDKEMGEFIDGCAESGTTGAGLVPINVARKVISDNIRMVEKDIASVVETLPIWTEWAQNISAVGKLTLGNIIGGSVCVTPPNGTGEAYTTIGDYANPAKLWKRWGVGVIEGERQRRVKASLEEKKNYCLTGEFTGDQAKAIRHGYSPERRSVLWFLGDGFVKQGRYYRRRYDQEKARQMEMHPEVMSDKFGNAKKKNYALLRAHNRAMRYATKLFLTDLWNKWRELHGEGAFHRASSERD